MRKGALYSEKNLLDMLGLIYEAASGFERWNGFLERYQAITEARNAAIGFLAPGQQQMIVATGADSGDVRKYHQYPCPWLERLMQSNWRNGGADSSHHLITDPDLERTECFSQFLGPRRFHYGMGAAVLALNDGPATFVVLREKARGAYSDDDLEFLRILLPHISRALQLSGRIAFLEASRTALMDSLDRLPAGVMLLNGQCRILFANRAAIRIADQNDGLRVAGGEISAAEPQESAALRRLLIQSARTSNGNGFHPGGEILLSRPSMRRPLSLAVSPLPSRDGIQGLPGGAAVAVFVSDPETAIESDGAMLRRLYGLTPAETRLAEAMTSGADLRSVADSLGISYHTARAQAKSVFAKTGTGRQAQLVQLLLKLPAQA